MHTTPTAHACPDWCDGPAGHPYDSEGKHGDLYRFHERIISKSRLVDIGLSSEEKFSAGSVTLPGPALTLYTRTDATELTTDEARALAAGLMAAADTFEKLDGAK